MREAVIIIPPTPEGILAEKMKKICREEMKENNIRLTIQERGERNLATLSATVCLEQEAHSTVKERGVLCAILMRCGCCVCPSALASVSSRVSFSKRQS